jgi:hypothetical protein
MCPETNTLPKQQPAHRGEVVDYNNHVSTLHQQDAFYYLFSKVPFSKACVSLAKQMGNVALIGLRDLFSFK